jgi:Tfp pilus assembly protein PilN
VRAVNLLPAHRRAPQGGGRPGSAYVLVGALGALLVAVLVYVLTANGLTSKQDELAQLKTETQAAQQRAAQLGSFGNFAAIKATREQSVAQLAQARLDWERLVREVSRVLPGDVTIAQLEATAASGTANADPAAAASSGPTLKLTGCAPSHPDVATTLVRLRRLHRANDVALGSAARAGSAEGDGECGRGVGFSATVSFDPAPATAPGRVPAHLGGGA